MTPARLLALTSLAMLAFAGNSLLCRLALTQTPIDPASFTSVRLLSGALMLGWLSRVCGRRTAAPASTASTNTEQRTTKNGLHTRPRAYGNWGSALALTAYAAGFSFAYVRLPAATGALLLFGAVQATMIGYGAWRGERLRPAQGAGFVLALGGLVALLLPGLAAPPLLAALWMLGAGVAWGVYSLRGRGAGDPTLVTAGNFLRAVPLALVLSLLTLDSARVDLAGLGYAIASGALASGVGYALWYSALPALPATHAATVQLSVPVIAALGGSLVLGEPLGWRLALAGSAILGGIALVIRRANTPNRAVSPSRRAADSG